jgi:hypothetical protein
VTPFREIIKRAVEATPDAVGGAFADGDGEMVDSFSTMHNAHDWAILTAHYGVILSHLHAAFGIWHFGGPEYFVARHAKLDIVVHALQGGYYALLALDRRDTPRTSEDLAHEALASLRAAATELHREMA